MSTIWAYADLMDEPEDVVGADACLFCRKDLVCTNHVGDTSTRHLSYCVTCGWWNVYEVETITMVGGADDLVWDRWEVISGAAAVLRNLDMTDVDVPIEEVRAYLTARYDSRFDIHPRVFERTVASVFASLGYGARVTAYSGDGGIDCILDGPGGDTIGVQVKRVRSHIEVSQIRELLGALMLRQLTRGIFVTTSTFQKGSRQVVRPAQKRGFKIELMDAPRFFQALGIAQRAAFDWGTTERLLLETPLQEVEVAHITSE